MKWLLPIFPVLLAFGLGIGAYAARGCGIETWWVLSVCCVIATWLSGFVTALVMDL